MARIVIELTNRCNLSCQHCFSGRHGGNDDLPLSVLRNVLDEAADLGFDYLAFTGGDPTVHPRFPEVLAMTSESGYRFGFVTNGWNFASIYPRILPYRQQLGTITFSLDGATEATHDALRGKGSYRRVMKAASVCVALDLPFTFNMVITASSRHELDQMARLASALGSQGLRFGHLMPSPKTTAQDLDLSPSERRVVESQIQDLRRIYSMPIGIAPGFYTTSLFPCAPLQMEEINIDCHGNLTKCCHLSSHGGGVGQGDVIGDLRDMSFAEAYASLVEENETFRAAKTQHLSSGSFKDTDYFPCWYCSLYYKKVDWLKRVKGNPWASLIPARESGAEHFQVAGSTRKEG